MDNLDWVQIFIQTFSTLAILAIIILLIYLPFKLQKSHREVKSRLERIEELIKKKND